MLAAVVSISAVITGAVETKWKNKSKLEFNSF
jgi:hypothetical protein